MEFAQSCAHAVLLRELGEVLHVDPGDKFRDIGILSPFSSQFFSGENLI